MFAKSAALRRSLLATLAYFDLFDYPLTLAEIVRFRYRIDAAAEGDPSYAEILAAVTMPRVGQSRGFYFLKGREAIVETRLRRYRIAERKFIRAGRAASLMRFLPSVLMVAVCNSLALSNAREDSDIDMFIVCRRGTVWSTRLIIVGVLKFFGLRPRERAVGDPLCVSFFVSENALCLEPLALPAGDTHLRYWIVPFVPLYAVGRTYARFVAANRAWLAPEVALAPRSVGRRRSLPRPFVIAPILGLLRRVEGLARRIQLSVLPDDLRSAMNRDSTVVLTDDILKFHLKDRRREFESRFQARLKEFCAEPVCAVS
ncbi:hypothetical protein HY633_05515 [Candidatus Uhrbacteria bacterium]|nr:hypothetical protein [Candidatus Uhrbacteria bacterium]